MNYIEHSEAELPKCRICGDTIPSGKTLCWCCEHASKLHPKDVVEDSACNSDFCVVDLAAKESLEVPHHD